MKSLPHGVDTETGDGGDALSGGQRTRVALARVLYQQPDIYIFDDILSALDTEVGDFIMRETIRGDLQNKTVIMSTHAIHWIEDDDRLLLLDRGTLLASGRRSELKSTNYFKQLVEINQSLKDHLHEKFDDSKTDSPDSKQMRQTTADSNTYLTQEYGKELNTMEGVLMLPEDRGQGGITYETIKTFVSELGGIRILVVGLTLAGVEQVFLNKSILYLTRWS